MLSGPCGSDRDGAEQSFRLTSLLSWGLSNFEFMNPADNNEAAAVSLVHLQSPLLRTKCLHLDFAR